MTSILEFQRCKDQFQKELFRRIGYTNTLYQIFRFGEVIKDTCGFFPISQSSLINIIRSKYPSLKTLKYATGIIDVLCSFNVLKRVGSRVVLTHLGRALAAISNQPWYDNIKQYFFLKLILQADGDYILNLLSILPSNRIDSDASKSLGKVFFHNILDLLNYRRVEINKYISTKLMRDFAIRYIQSASDSIRYDILNEQRPLNSLTREDRIKRVRAMKSGKKVRDITEPTDTLRHTLDPRRGWITDLQLVTRDDEKKYRLTKEGKALLESIKSAQFQVNSVFRVPFSESLINALGISEIPYIKSDYFNYLAVHVYLGSPVPEYSGKIDDFYSDLNFFFELTRLKQFKQAEILALYECLAMKAAYQGMYLSKEKFYELLGQLLEKYQHKLYKVAGRYRQEGYISFRR